MDSSLYNITVSEFRNYRPYDQFHQGFFLSISTKASLRSPVLSVQVARPASIVDECTLTFDGKGPTTFTLALPDMIHYSLEQLRLADATR